ncbi:MAG: hypothetical protein PHW63_03925 [Alphaproteobacteria bacterium]|nr:hypothetical protein [Alphaproteobacteria bacterium]
MPYVLRNSNDVIIKASTQSMPGASMIPYDHPDMVAFLEKKGQSAQVLFDTLAELRRTDNEMARAIEDVIMALFKKNVLKMGDLPIPVQDRMALRMKLRMNIQEMLDQASN